MTAGWLARRWRVTAWTWRLLIVALVCGLAVINATGVYAQLVAAHMGERGAAQSAIETQDAALAARIDVQAHTVADLDRRLGQIDFAIEEAAKRGRTTTALTAIAAQRKSREALVEQRRAEASTLADLKAERSALGAKGRQIETEATPIRCVAELVGADTDSERAIRWLILMMVLCCDPLAIALTTAASAPRWGVGHAFLAVAASPRAQTPHHFAGTFLYAILRKPIGVARPPVMVMICGLVSCKEETDAYEQSPTSRAVSRSWCSMGRGRAKPNTNSPFAATTRRP